MKICFIDIETVPTDRSLEENGLLEAQLQLDEGDLIKKLSLSAATAKILCLCYAIEPPVGSEVQVLEGDETEIIKEFWKLAVDCNLFVGQTFLILTCVLFTSARSSIRSNPRANFRSRVFAALRSSIPCMNGANGAANMRAWICSQEPSAYHRRKKVWMGRKFILITAPGNWRTS